MIDLLKLQPEEAERIAYAEGFTMAGELFARIAELTAERDQLAEELETVKDAAEDTRRELNRVRESIRELAEEHGAA